MSIQSDKLRDLVDNVYPTIVSNLTTSIASIDAQITELNAQKDAIEWGMDQAQTDQETRLVAKGYDYNYYESSFGTSDLSSFHLATDLVLTATYVSDTSFTVPGDQTLIIGAGDRLIVGSGDCLCTVSTSVYTTSTTVTVTLDDESNVVASGDVYEIGYEYLGTGWDSDSNILGNINYYSEAYEHLTEPLGTTGTYGINDKITKFGVGKSIQQYDKAKYEDLITAYDRFAT